MKTRLAIFGYWPIPRSSGSSNMIPRQSDSRHTRLAPVLSAWLVASFSMIEETDFGCHRVWASITLTGAQNISRAFFNTMRATRIASTITALISMYQDRGGVLWVGTEKGGLNILNFQQKQFGRYMHRPGDPNSLSPGMVTAIYQDSEGILWVGFSPRALDRLDRKTGQVTHYVLGLEDRNAIEKGY